MSGFDGKTYWIIGASEGLGRALAEALNHQGAHLILSARNATRLDQICDRLPNARAIPMDVTDLDSVRRAVVEAGEIDGLVYNAGAYDPMRAVESTVCTHLFPHAELGSEPCRFVISVLSPVLLFQGGRDAKLEFAFW